MTKTEILKRIDDVLALYANTSKKVFEINQLPSVNADAMAISSALLLISGVISDTMNTLSLILCEMLPEEAPEKDPEPKKGTHYEFCNEKCQCVTCVNDNSEAEGTACCTEHGFMSCCVHGCPDYVKEG